MFESMTVAPPDTRELAAVFAGGALGALCRGLLGEVYAASPTSWPWVTFGVNLVGAFLLGYFATSVLRFVVDCAVSSWTGRSFPFGTLVINLSGAVLLGLITGLALNHDVVLLAGTAAVGSYTTFSTWMFETQRLAEDRQRLGVAANVLVSMAAGILAAALGQLLGGYL